MPLASLNVNHAKKLVFLTSGVLKVADQTPPVDPFFFGVSTPFPSKTVGLHRNTEEYCQWAEQRHLKQIKIGQEPGICSSNTKSKSQPEHCSHAKCSLRSPLACEKDGCCKVKSGDSIYREEGG